MPGTREIVSRFLEARLQVHPDVVDYIRTQGDDGLVDEIIASVPKGTLVATAEHIPERKTECDGTRFLTEPDFEVVRGAASSERGGVDFADFAHYFRNRYDRLSAMLRTRVNAMPIEGLVRTSRYLNQEVSVIGMVVEVRTTAKGHRMIQLEDPTSRISVLFNKDREVFMEGEKIVPDEVIAVKGKLSSDGNLFFADTISRPDIPLSHAPYKSPEPGKVVLISDVHVGSDTFLEEAWERFSDWIASEEEISYLLIAGDLVDGIGIYPGQEKELTIPNIYRQYEVFGRMLSALPERLKIIVSPGNHDVVRGSEPQPALSGEFCKTFPPNVTLVENPALVSLQGVRVLMYHGRSYDDLIASIPGATYTHPEEMMIEMLKRRHLACTYGLKTPILAAKEDRLIIDPIPEILHTGHVHICGIAQYRGVLAVNTGTWQSQTGFQKQMNIQPTPGRAVVIDLQTLAPEVKEFL